MNKQEEKLEVENNSLLQIAELKTELIIVQKRIEALSKKIACYCENDYEVPEYLKKKLFKAVYKREKLNEEIYELTEEANNEKL